MPLYQYTCQKCNVTFDQLVRTADRDANIKCPECGSPKTARALSLVAVGAADSKGAPSAGAPGCGRCGDPRGSCSM